MTIPLKPYKFWRLWVQANWNISISEVSFALVIPYLFVEYVLLNFFKLITGRWPVFFFELKIVSSETDFSSDELFWPLLSAVFPEYPYPPGKRPPCSFVQEGVNNSRKLLKEMVSDSPELYLGCKGCLLFLPSSYQNV